MNYPIRAVSKLTGVAIDTLRAWERRYGAVMPARDHRGRLYSDADVSRLRLLKGAVAQGHPIGRIASCSDAQLRKAATRADTARARSTSPIDTRALVEAITHVDAAAVDAEIARDAATLAPDAFATTTASSAGSRGSPCPDGSRLDTDDAGDFFDRGLTVSDQAL